MQQQVEVSEAEIEHFSQPAQVEEEMIDTC